MPNYQLAASIASAYGLQWLRSATDKQLGDATDKALRELGLSQDSRLAIVCLKAIRAYADNIRLCK